MPSMQFAKPFHVLAPSFGFFPRNRRLGEVAAERLSPAIRTLSASRLHSDDADRAGRCAAAPVGICRASRS